MDICNENVIPYLLESTMAMIFVIILLLWDTLWKLCALWRAARRGDSIWFICLALINSVGLLPIIYLITHRAKGE